MTPLQLVGLLFDGTQVLLTHSRMVALLSVQILGIGALGIWGVSAAQETEIQDRWVAGLSLGLCGFVLLSYALVGIATIFHLSLSGLAMGMLIFSSLGVAMGVLIFVKKKNVLSD